MSKTKTENKDLAASPVNALVMCPDCGSEMTDFEVPEFWFQIPFTKIGVYRLVLHEYCDFCHIDKLNHQRGEIYDVGKEDGFREGYYHGLTGT